MQSESVHWVSQVTIPCNQCSQLQTAHVRVSWCPPWRVPLLPRVTCPCWEEIIYTNYSNPNQPGSFPHVKPVDYTRFYFKMGKRDLIISVFKTQCLKCPYCPFSSVSIKSSYCPYCPRVHKVSALSRLSSNEVSWLSGHPGWGGGVHPQRRSVTTRIYWLLHFGPWTRYTLWMVEL